MDGQTRARYEARAKIVKALAHPTRLFIVDQLTKDGGKCVCDLTDQIGADMSTVSKHLALLKEAGILRDEKRGAMVFYQLGTRCIQDFLECVESLLLGNAEAQQKLFGSESDRLPGNGDGGHRSTPPERVFSWMAGDAPIMAPPGKTSHSSS